jgi:hypothetical protein
MVPPPFEQILRRILRRGNAIAPEEQNLPQAVRLVESQVRIYSHETFYIADAAE